MDDLCRRILEAIEQDKPNCLRHLAVKAVEEIRRSNDENAQNAVRAFLCGMVAGGALAICGAVVAAIGY